MLLQRSRIERTPCEFDRHIIVLYARRRRPSDRLQGTMSLSDWR